MKRKPKRSAESRKAYVSLYCPLCKTDRSRVVVGIEHPLEAQRILSQTGRTLRYWSVAEQTSPGDALPHDVAVALIGPVIDTMVAHDLLVIDMDTGRREMWEIEE